MNNKAKAGKAAAGVVGLAVGIVATTVVVSELAVETPETTTVAADRPGAAHRYSGPPRIPHVADGWLSPTREYAGPTTPDAAEHWLRSGTEYAGPTTPDAAEHWFAAYHEWEDRTVDNYVDRVANGRMSMRDFETLASARVSSGDWTQGLVDRILELTRMETVAQLYEGCKVYSAGRLDKRLGC
jgi:hypothetical protein